MKYKYLYLIIFSIVLLLLFYSINNLNKENNNLKVENIELIKQNNNLRDSIVEYNKLFSNLIFAAIPKAKKSTINLGDTYMACIRITLRLDKLKATLKYKYYNEEDKDESYTFLELDTIHQCFIYKHKPLTKGKFAIYGICELTNIEGERVKYPFYLPYNVK